jgi:hypothetical protein
LSHPIAAPDFWLSSGVSDLPAAIPFDTRNYWSLYADAVLHVPMQIVGAGEATAAYDPQATFVAIPSGTPATLLFERVDTGSHLTILAHRPVSLRLLSRRDSAIITMPASEWHCETMCKHTMNLAPETELADLIIQADGKGAVGLLSQFLLPRGGAFGSPP